MKRHFFVSILLIALLSTGNAYTQQASKLDSLVSKTDYTSLSYDTSQIIVRGFDGEHPPPKKVEDGKRILYSYGVCAYIFTPDSTTWFSIMSFNSFYRDQDGNEIKSFKNKKTYSKGFRQYFLEALEKEDWDKLYLRDVYLRDKDKNVIKLKGPFKMYPVL